MNIIKLFFLLLASLPLLTIAQSKSVNRFLDINQDFLNLEAVSSAELPPDGLIIKKDVAIFDLLKGEIYRFSKVNGKEWALLFKGEGEFIYTPPVKVEKDQLKRFLGKESLREKISSLFILFADTSVLSAVSELEFKDEPSSYTNREFKWMIKYLCNSDQDYFNSDFIKAALEEDNNTLFYSHIVLENGDPLFFEISPYENEEIFLKQKQKGYVFGTQQREVINNFHKISKYSSNKTKEVFQPDFRIGEYKIKINITSGLDFYGECEAVVNPIRNNNKWIKFFIYRDLIVDSVFINNENVNFIQADSELWIQIPSPENNTSFTIKSYYSGDILEKNEFGMVLLKSSLLWYPKYGYREHALYDISFTVPDKYKIVSVGELVSQDTNDDGHTSRWVSNVPIRNASFNIGDFDIYTYSDDDDNKVNVYISESTQRLLSKLLVDYEILSGSNMKEKIGTDILASIQFYRNVFGKIPLKELNVTPIPYSHGEAFPGLVHLSWSNYQGIQYDKSGELFRAHETAHQWWGIGVDFETYHDQWLSEAFAEYSALWFVQLAFNDNEEFFDILNDWKKLILNNRQYLFSSGQEAGPVWLGYRTQSSETEGDYWLIIYKKGAWVLHMLRNMLSDLNTMNEDAFTNMLREFFSTYYGRKANTDDFKRTTEKYTKQDMSWFFNQFVYGTDIPNYKFSYKSEKTEDGKYRVICKVIQEGVPDNFRMYIPIKIILSGDRFARLRLEVKEKETIINLPLLPDEPEEIIFNDLNSVLCDVDYVNWE